MENDVQFPEVGEDTRGNKVIVVEKPEDKNGYTVSGVIVREDTDHRGNQFATVLNYWNVEQENQPKGIDPADTVMIPVDKIDLTIEALKKIKKVIE